MTGTSKATALSPRQILDGQRVLRISRLVKKRIATWNVRSMSEAGKVHTAIKKMKSLIIEILGINEIGWPNSSPVQVKGYHVFYAGNENERHHNGVGIIGNEKMKGTIKAFASISDRANAPTCDHPDEEAKIFYEQINSAMRLVNKADTAVVMGDFNAKVGNVPREDIVGGYDLDIPSELGDRLVQFCQEKGLIITNTFFKLPSRHLYSWRSNAETPEKIIRN